MPNTDELVLALRKSGGYAPLDNYRVIKISGRDAVGFLQSRLSNDVKLLENGQGQLTTLLDRKAHVLALMSIHRLDDEFWVVIDESQVETVMAQFETFLFREQVSFAVLNQLRLWTVQGPKSELFLSLGLQSADKNQTRPAIEDLAICRCRLWNEETVLIRCTLTGEPGLIFIAERDEWSTFVSSAENLGLSPISSPVLETARIEAGILIYGKDVTAENLLPETGLENNAASYSKGCFQGQEVLARIKTFGAPRRGLVGLTIQPGTPGLGAELHQLFSPANGTAIELIRTASDGTDVREEIGSVTSSIWSPTLKRGIALAYVSREYRVPGETLQVQMAGTRYSVTVVLLPFYTASGRAERAQARYREALAEFTNGSEEAAIAMLRDTIELDPIFADAYEALGVILSRHDQLDEAISLMKRLEQLDPDSIMAHSNLSVFYMQQGNKELAEEEKAIAMSIRMTQLAKQHAAQQKEKEDEAKKQQDALERIELFKQVLAIDPDDFLANSGMGGALVDLGRFDEALMHLEKAVAVRSNHTVTYVALGRAYESLNKRTEAAETYKKGIALAAQRGEMTPLKEMQSRLDLLN